MSILFLDIETAPVHKTFDDLPEDGKAAFEKKVRTKIESGQYLGLSDAYEKEAALYAEFSKVICIGLSTVIIDKNDDNKEKLYLKGLIGEEAAILAEFLTIIEKVGPTALCAHNGLAFDFPFLCRRLLITGFALPSILDVNNRKPWEMPWIDTAQLWQFNDRRYYVSLITLAFAFGIPSPKQELDGSQVPAAYYRGEISKIKSYCIVDTYTLARIYRKMKSLSDITETIQP